MFLWLLIKANLNNNFYRYQFNISAGILTLKDPYPLSLFLSHINLVYTDLSCFSPLSLIKTACDFRVVFCGVLHHLS